MEFFGLFYLILAAIIRWQFWLAMSLISIFYVIMYDHSSWIWLGLMLILTLITSFIPKKWKDAIKMPDTV